MTTRLQFWYLCMGIAVKLYEVVDMAVQTWL